MPTFTRDTTSPAPSVFPAHVALIGNLGIGLFFGLMFSLRSGYSYGAALLLIASLWCALAPSCRPRRRALPTLGREDQLLMGVLLAYFAVAAGSITWLDNNFRDLDQPLRAALAAPVLWMLCRMPYDLRWLWGSVIVGVSLSVGVAWWQLHVLGMDRAEGYLNIIHFGNIALVYGAFCAAGLQWSSTLRKQRYMWCAVFLLGMACSAYSIVASGSRASWVALPALIALYGVAFLNRRNVGWVVGCCGVIIAAAGFMFSQPDSKVRARYDAAISDIQLFQQGKTDTSLGARFVMWDGAIRSIPERPFLGWNFAEYHSHIQRLVEREEVDPVALKFTNNLHNGYLHSWIFHGLPGLLALLALYLVPFAGFCRRLRSRDMNVRVLAYCGAALCASYAFFSVTQVILQRNNGIMFYVLALVVLWGGMRQWERRKLNMTHASMCL